MRRGGATIADVAARAEVSLSTVSRVMNGSTTVDAALAERVREAASSLGYSASPLARSLVLGTTQTIAVVVPDLGNPTFQGALRGLSDGASEHGYHVLVADSHEQADQERVLALDARRRCDGIVLCAPRMPAEELAAVLPLLAPVVVINRIPEPAATASAGTEASATEAAGTAAAATTAAGPGTASAGSAARGPAGTEAAGAEAAGTDAAGAEAAGTEAAGTEAAGAEAAAPDTAANVAQRRPDAAPHVPSVVADYKAGLTALLDHLYGLGHRDMLYLAGSRQAASNLNRLAAIREFQASHSDASVATSPCGVGFEDGHASAQAVVDSDATAVLAFNDLVAMGLLSALGERGVRVPEDVSVTGFDDIPFARYTTPPLTTAAIPVEDLGEQAWQRMWSLLEGTAPAHDLSFGPHVIPRGSTGPAPQSPRAALSRETRRARRDQAQGA
ncbi:hypothetical protein GCM10028798_00580 [Humibacter antri]